MRIRPYKEKSLAQVADYEKKFWARVEKLDGCWIWTGRKNGAGCCKYYGHETSAHRVAWILIGREIPDGMNVARTCGNVLCVNPDHCELVTDGEMGSRGYFKTRQIFFKKGMR
jgi:hypothetical protein